MTMSHTEHDDRSPSQSHSVRRTAAAAAHIDVRYTSLHLRADHTTGVVTRLLCHPIE
jgi:hypothetical protein